MLTNYKDTGYRTYDIDLQQKPEDRWTSFVEAERDNLESLLQDVITACEEDLDYVPESLRTLIRQEGVAVSGAILSMISSTFGEEYIKEIKGIARAAGLPVGQIFLANLMYDLVLAQERVALMWGQAGQFLNRVKNGFQSWRGACSSYSNLIRGKPVLVRNMDWSLPESIGRHTRVIRFHRGKNFYTSVSVIGSVGTLSALMKGKWGVTLNQAPLGSTRLNLFQWPVMHRIRNVCDQMYGYAGTVNALQTYQTMTPFFAHVVGSKPAQQTIVAGRGQYFYERQVGDFPLIQTNHSVGYAEEDNPPTGEFIDEYGDLSYWDTYPRFDELVRRLKRRPTTMKATYKKMAGEPVTHDGTQHQMLICPATGTMMLKIKCDS